MSLLFVLTKRKEAQKVDWWNGIETCFIGVCRCRTCGEMI